MDTNDKDPNQLKVTEAKTKLGIMLFFISCFFYACFILINTISPKLMEIEVCFGLNLAPFYGFGLIILAIIMGLIYNYLCTNIENKYHLNNGEGKS